jgi:hypothetical protein
MHVYLSNLNCQHATNGGLLPGDKESSTKLGCFHSTIEKVMALQTLKLIMKIKRINWKEVSAEKIRVVNRS